MLKHFALLSCLLCFSAGANQNYAGQASMNGIRFDDYKDFTESWQLVTIRYRKDTGEMRLTYANKSAMDTLLSGGINYPDGAVFAKTGIHTGVDDQFPSSVVPTGVRRYQLMVKDKKKYATTGGWGYGLFDAQGKTFPEDPVASQNACYACHAIVPNRGDVFSQAFSFVKGVKFPVGKGVLPETQLKFEWREPKRLPSTLAQVLKPHKRVRFLTNKKLRANVFQGTLDELKPLLEQESRKSQAPAIFLSSDEQRYILLIPTTSDTCLGEGAFKTLSTDMSLRPVEEIYCTHD